MDPGQTRVLLQDETVFFRRLVLFSLQFKCFRVEFMRLIRIWCCRRQFLCRPSGEIGIRVDRDKEDIGIAREFSVQEAKKLYCRIWLVVRHGAAYAYETGLAFKIFVCILSYGFSQQWDSLIAMTLVAELNSGGQRNTRWFCGVLAHRDLA